MKLNYRKIGDFIQQVNTKNEDGNIGLLLGVNLDKVFINSVANTIGTDMTKYKVIKNGQFGCKLMSVGRDKKLPISRLVDYEKAIISSAYYVFEVIDENQLNPEYLMMWFSRPESDRYLWFQSGGDVRGRITWDDLCQLPIKVPSIEKQREIVKEYNTIVNRIKLNETLNQKLEDTAQALYKHWFVDFEFPNAEGKPYKSSGGEMVYNEELDMEIPVGCEIKTVKEFTKDMKSGATPNRGVSEYWDSNDIPWLKTGELKNGVIINSEEYISELGLKESSTKILPKNTVLIAMYGQGETKGQVGYLKIESTTNQACCAMISENEIHGTYLYYHLRLNRKEIVSVAIGGAQPNLSKEIIENIKLLIPKEDVLEKHPFVDIMNYRESLTRENYHLNVFKNITLSKMSKVDTKTAVV